MEPALDVIERTLHGDDGARAFVERTSSIYVLDVTDNTTPKTYGCWNFIHQALNEVERHESRNVKNAKSKNGEGEGSPTAVAVLRVVPHVRLLASMALRVARRSPQGDRAIVATCISNASDFQCSASQSQWLYDLNLELREIVMGRIAAIAFDFSFYRLPRNAARDDICTLSSAFADPVVMDTFCAILAANAVASGPASVRNFATEWIIPSSRNIPTLALVSVVHHLALEGSRPAAPAGTKDTLQQLSVPICSLVIVPAMAGAVSDENEEELTSSVEMSPFAVHSSNARILAKALSALNAWCGTTALTLPQVRHLSTKVNLNFVGILNDAMYSDSSQVIGALADFIDRVVEVPLEKEILDDRLNQVRHIIQVNEAAFKANFSSEHFRVIETKEMASILEELSSSVALQRNRFRGRQVKGDVEVCHYLARIGKDIYAAWYEICSDGGEREPARGLVEFLLETASHPSLNVCCMALSVSPLFISKRNSRARELLPMLQRKAIIPHRIHEGIPCLVVDPYGSSVQDFLRFRETVVTDALASCCRFDSEAYMDSCSSAIEEFCSERENGANLSFHLEAALFCIESLGDLLMTATEHSAFSPQLSRCVESLSRKSNNISSNPLTLARMSIFLQKSAAWFEVNNKISVASDLATASLSYSMILSVQAYAHKISHDAGVSAVFQACRAFQCILLSAPSHFAQESNLNTVFAVWRSLWLDRKQPPDLSVVPIGPLGNGLCLVILHVPEDLRSAAFEMLALPVVEAIRDLLEVIRGRDAVDVRAKKDKLLETISDYVSMLGSFVLTFSTGEPIVESDESMMIVDDDDENDDRRPKNEELPPFVEPVIRECWPSISSLALEHSEKPRVSKALCRFLAQLIPPNLNSDSSLLVLQDTTAIVLSMIERVPESPHLFANICKYFEAWIQAQAERILEPVAIQGLENSLLHKQAADLFRSLLTQLVAKAHHCLGPAWPDENNQKIEEQQRQGEQAFESRPPPKLDQSFCHCLAPLLSLFQMMVTSCPTLLLSIPSHEGTDKLLIQRITSSTVCALSTNDSGLVWNSISFFSSMMSTTTTTQTEMERKRHEIVVRVRTGLMRRLFKGCCGRYEHFLLGPASDLLWKLLRAYPIADAKSDFEMALQQEEFFLMGDDARRCLISCLCHICSGEGTWSVADLLALIEQVWALHRIDAFDALPASDSVTRFIRKFGAVASKRSGYSK